MPFELYQCAIGCSSDDWFVLELFLPSCNCKGDLPTLCTWPQATSAPEFSECPRPMPILPLLLPPYNKANFDILLSIIVHDL